jgi:hypothetical protein
LNIVFDQFPAPNDNSYGVNAVGWGSHGHTFSNLVGSDHAGFQLKDPGGVVRLSFNIDYISANASAPSGYASLGPFGGDGSILVGSLTPADIAFTTSLANNLNNVNIPGLFNASHVQQFGSVNVLVNSPPTDPAHQTYTNSDPALTGWDFHDTYFVTIAAAKLASLGFNPRRGPSNRTSMRCTIRRPKRARQLLERRVSASRDRGQGQAGEGHDPELGNRR